MDFFCRRNNSYTISCDQKLIDMKLTHAFLKDSYWAKDIPREIFEKSAKNSLCFGVYADQKQIGFARVVSDYATFAYLGDVFITPAHRGKGLSKWLMQAVTEHPDLQGLRRFCLGTKDAHKLYEKYGFEVIKEPQNWMEIKNADIYSRFNKK